MGVGTCRQTLAEAKLPFQQLSLANPSFVSPALVDPWLLLRSYLINPAFDGVISTPSLS